MDELSQHVIEAFSWAIDSRTGNPGHSVRVARYLKRIAQELGFDEESQREMELGGLIHDIGQVFVRYELYRSTTSYQSQEFRAEIETHTVRGAQVLSEFPTLAGLLPYIACHQENIDGSGYPEHLKGAAIPTKVQLLSIVDVYEALRHPRVYREQYSLSHEEALNHMKKFRGRRWCEDVFDSFEKACHVLVTTTDGA